MTALNSADLSNILCLFRLLRTSSRVDLTSILAWNKEFEFSPSEQHEDPKPPWAGILNLNSRRDPIYALRFSEKPKKDGTWVFGSLDGSRNDGLRGTVPTGKDQSRCDFQLSPSHVGSNISRSHFSIELAPRVRRGAPVIIPRLKCLKGSVAVNHVNDPDHPALLNPGDELLLDQPTNILCAALQLQVWAPTLTPEELAEQRTTANEFERDIATALPGFFPGIRSGVDTRHGNTRVGLESGNFYVCFEEKAPPNTSVVPSCVVWSGPLRLSATVPPIESRDSPGSVKSKVEGLMKAFKNGGCIRHPNILAIHEIAVYRGVDYEDNVTEAPWLITAFIKGTITLEDCIRSGLAINGSDVIAQLASGLACLMSQGVVHTAFTPESIVMVETERGKFVPKIAGLERLERLGGKQYLEDRVTTPTICTAPERLQSPYHCSYAAPAYGLGAIALRMLTSYDSRMEKYEGGPPITRQSYGEWITKVVLPSVKQAPDDTRRLVKGLLNSKPDERWTAKECYIFLKQGLLPCRQARSNGDRGERKKRQRLDASSAAPTSGARTIRKSARGRHASTAPRSEPQTTEETSARVVKRRRREQHVHFTEGEKPAEVKGEPPINETRQSRAEEMKDDKLLDAQSWDNVPQDPDDAGGAADGARPRKSFADICASHPPLLPYHRISHADSAASLETCQQPDTAAEHVVASKVQEGGT